MNIQPAEKRQGGDGATLDVQSIFPTIQGEGPFTGQRAVFVRLAGCNLLCPACDTDYTSNRRIETVDYIIGRVKEMFEEGVLVVITGGEPFRQNLGPLVTKLVNDGHRVQVETNGTLPPSEGIPALVEYNLRASRGCFIVCSPKAGKVNPELEPLICAYKYVLSCDSVSHIDGLPLQVLDHGAVPRVARPHLNFIGPVYLQPRDDRPGHHAKNSRHLEAVVNSCLRHGHILQLQIHKIIGVE